MVQRKVISYQLILKYRYQLGPSRTNWSLLSEAGWLASPLAVYEMTHIIAVLLGNGFSWALDMITLSTPARNLRVARHVHIDQGFNGRRKFEDVVSKKLEVQVKDRMSKRG